MAYIGQAPTNAPLTSSDIEDGVIVAADLAPNSVDSSELVDGSIDTSHIGANQVTAAKVAADVATQAELEAQRTDSSITTLGTVTAGNLSHANIVYPAGHVVTMSTLVNHTGTASSVFDNDADTNGFESGLECTLDVTSTTNKIFVLACFTWGTDSSNSCEIRMFATKSGQSDVLIGHNYAHMTGNYQSTSIGMSGIHSPAVTGEWVYKIYGQSAGDMRMNGKHSSGGTVAAHTDPISCIIAYEVKQ